MAAVGESGPQPDSDDPYAQLGLSAGASFEQVQSAKQRCLTDSDDDPQAKARIEAAYDAFLQKLLLIHGERSSSDLYGHSDSWTRPYPLYA